MKNIPVKSNTAVRVARVGSHRLPVLLASKRIIFPGYWNEEWLGTLASFGDIRFLSLLNDRSIQNDFYNREKPSLRREIEFFHFLRSYRICLHRAQQNLYDQLDGNILPNESSPATLIQDFFQNDAGCVPCAKISTRLKISGASRRMSRRNGG